MIERYYPRRTDAVRATQFDGTLESAQAITEIVRPLSVNAAVSWLGLASLSIDGTTVEHNQYVVATQGDSFKVLGAEEFRRQYSPDGL